MKRFAIICLALASCHQKPKPVEAPPVAVKVVEPRIADVPRYKTYIGNISPFIQVQVRSQVEGLLTGVFFTEGQEVKEGDLLFTIDPRPYEAQLEKAQAALALTEANLHLAQETVQRYTKLSEVDYVAKLQYDQYLTQVQTNEATIKQSLADIESAKINLSYCTIHSPINALTGVLQIKQGNLIQNAGQEPLILLNQITPIYCYFSVPQNDLPEIMRFHRSSPLKIQVNSYNGVLDLIDNQINNKTGAILLRGIFPNEDKMLWPGEFAEVQLVLEELKNALVLPSDAVFIDQNGTSVFVIKPDQTAELRKVDVLERIEKESIISSGLKPGEKVVVEGQINLISGTKVVVK